MKIVVERYIILVMLIIGVEVFDRCVYRGACD